MGSPGFQLGRYLGRLPEMQANRVTRASTCISGIQVSGVTRVSAWEVLGALARDASKQGDQGLHLHIRHTGKWGHQGFSLGGRLLQKTHQIIRLGGTAMDGTIQECSACTCGLWLRP